MNRTIHILLLGIVFLFACDAYAQHWPKSAEEVIEWWCGQDDSDERLEEELRYRVHNPLLLNRTTKEELAFFPFLSDQQIESFLAYRSLHSGLLSIYELKLIEGWDLGTISDLLPFVELGDYLPPKKALKEQIAQEFFLRTARCLNEKEGYRGEKDESSAETINKRYLGGPWYNTMRYRLTAGEHWQMGVVAEKDAGEPFMKDGYSKYGFDYYSLHLATGNYRYLKSLLVGDYKLTIGQGVVMNQSFSMSKSFPASHTGALPKMIRPHYSSSEDRFLRGVAATFALGGGEYSFFYSYRRMDANMRGDSVTSFKEDGYHRTLGEWNKKQVLPMQLIGGRLYYERKRGEIGLTGLAYFFGKPIVPIDRPYNRYYFRGKNNYNLGIDFRFHWHRLHFFGEWGMSGNGAIAGITSLQIPISSRLYLLTSYRNYSKRYQAYYAAPFAESSSSNEQGFFASMEYKPRYGLSLQGSFDYFRFPYLRYRVDYPSDGWELLLKADYAVEEKWKLRLELSSCHRQQNSRHDALHLQTLFTHRLKGQWVYTWPAGIRLKTTANGQYYRNEEGKRWGFLLGEELVGALARDSWKYTLSTTFFHAPYYEVRGWIYQYKGPYASSSTMLYGKGGAAMLGVQYRYRRRLTCGLYYSLIGYTDRETIGSGTEKIVGKIKNDCSFYLLFQW